MIVNSNIIATKTSSAWLTNRWVVCLTASLFFLYEFIQVNVFNSISQDVMRAFNLNATSLGLMSASYFYATVGFLLPAGQILDRYSTRKVILVSLGICIVATATFALTTSLWLAVFCRFVSGIGSSFCFLSNFRLASRWFPLRNIALITGIVATVGMVGGVLAQTPFTILAQSAGWRHALLIDAALGLLVGLLIYWIVQDCPPQGPTNAIKKQPVLDYWGSIKQAYFSRHNWLCGLYTCLLNLPLVLLGALWGTLYLQQVHGFSRTDASAMCMMLFIGTIVGSPIIGFVSDKLANRRWPMLLGAVLSLFTIIVILGLQENSAWEFFSLFFLLGFFSSSQILGYPTAAESNPLKIAAMSASVVSFTTMSGYIVFQPLFGWLMDLHRQLPLDVSRYIYSAADYKLAMMLIPLGFIVAFFGTFFLSPKPNTPIGEETAGS